MGSTQRKYTEALYGPERARTLKSRLFVLLRDELGLGRQPKVARLLVDEIVGVVEATMVDASVLEPGQLLVLCPELGQGPSWTWRKLEDKRMKTVRLTLIDPQEIERLAAGEPLRKVRRERLVRLAKEAYEQGATLTSCQLAVMSGIHPSTVSAHLHEYTQETGELVPLRGVIEDCSPASSSITLPERARPRSPGRPTTPRKASSATSLASSRSVSSAATWTRLQSRRCSPGSSAARSGSCAPI